MRPASGRERSQGGPSLSVHSFLSAAGYCQGGVPKTVNRLSLCYTRARSDQDSLDVRNVAGYPDSTCILYSDPNDSVVSRIYYRILMFFVVGLAFSLRQFHLDAQSLWYDEGVTAIVAQYDLAALTRWTANDIQPPLYYALVAGWGRLAGWSEWSLRYPSVFFGTLTPLLLAALARRLTGSRLHAFLAALFAAIHPLLVYYSQEARMYTLLVSLGVLCAYCIVRIAQTPVSTAVTGHRPQILLWGIYVIAAIAALYTHYFAAFLLLAVNIAYLHWSRRSNEQGVVTMKTARAIALAGHRHDNGGVATGHWGIANGMVFLLFCPWLGTLFTRLDMDTSYWQGSLKLWEALGKTFISFTSGVTVLEAEATRLLWMYGAVTILALIGGYQASRSEGRAPDGIPHPAPQQYSFLITLLPILGILALASVTPKFNARYMIIALPGLILLWSNGLAALLQWPMKLHAIGVLAGLGGSGLLVGGFLFATANWFTDPAFTKDQWRELVSYVQVNKQPDEAIVLVSGHAWPIWHYYVWHSHERKFSGMQPQMDPLRLPQIETLDVNAVLNLSDVAEPLRAGLAGKSAAWLINWQQEVIDPTDVTGFQIGRAGDEIPVSAEFWGLRLRYFDGLEAIASPLPTRPTPVAQFGDIVQLDDYTVDEEGDLILFWRLLEGGDALRLADYHLTLQTFTDTGLLFARPPDRRLAAYNYPVFRWPRGQTVLGRVPAMYWLGEGAPAGGYWVRLGVYDPDRNVAGLDVTGAAGEQLGKQAILKPTLTRPLPYPLDEEPTNWHEISENVFVKSIPSEDNRQWVVEQGQAVDLQLLWYTSRAQVISALITQWNEQDKAGQQHQIDLQLPAGMGVRTRHRVRSPEDLPPGDYQLALTVDQMPSRPLLISFRITPSSRVFSKPTLALEINAAFGDQVLLQGLTEGVPPSVQPGQTLTVALSWESLAPAQDYALTIQWLDATGIPAAQLDQKLNGGASNWLPGEVISQILEVPVPEKPGPYRLILAVYDPDLPALPRLQLPSGMNYTELGQVDVNSSSQ